ncbi:hypothetical protein Mal48_15640 [Thalassoglobus polymorphus]|uniref:Uncharacterized protein n=1 Tax=Thalassoglobus polymorphus TaxID=2527994 RepID=A0A517QL37_9PLAN|nr:hypothetical protein Mal48_15640 [Thalassoglobus polymorphus]
MKLEPLQSSPILKYRKIIFPPLVALIVGYVGCTVDVFWIRTKAYDTYRPDQKLYKQIGFGLVSGKIGYMILRKTPESVPLQFSFKTHKPIIEPAIRSEDHWDFNSFSIASWFVALVGCCLYWLKQIMRLAFLRFWKQQATETL